MHIGLIAGTGMGELIAGAIWREVSTPYGTASLSEGVLGGREVLFVRRHGPELNIPPHLINYRANFAALADAGVTHVLATSAVGSLHRKIKPGTLAVLGDFIDFSKSAHTIFDRPGSEVVHTDFTEPYCPNLSEQIERAASELGITLGERLIYVSVSGPRYETLAEVRMFAAWGDVVGMTGAPEAVLAREMGIHYASLAVVTNYAAGIEPKAISHREVVEMMAEQKEAVQALLVRTVENL
ncbi:MAG: MTAP family purine nucleoside phosphorylase [Armatimonadota bacterium]